MQHIVAILLSVKFNNSFNVKAARNAIKSS